MALGTLSPVLDQYDQVNRVPDYSCRQEKNTSYEDRDVIIKQLQEARVFTDSDNILHLRNQGMSYALLIPVLRLHERKSPVNFIFLDYQ